MPWLFSARDFAVPNAAKPERAESRPESWAASAQPPRWSKYWPVYCLSLGIVLILFACFLDR
jgi:hypothetical protein